MRGQHVYTGTLQLHQSHRTQGDLDSQKSQTLALQSIDIVCAEIQRKLVAITEDQLPAAGLAMETLTIGRETAIKLYCEKISSTVKSEMIPSIMLKSYYACCT